MGVMGETDFFSFPCCSNIPPARAISMHTPAATEYHTLRVVFRFSGVGVWKSFCICCHNFCHSCSGFTCWPYSFSKNAIRFVTTSSNRCLFPSSCNQFMNSSSSNRSGSRKCSSINSILSSFSSICIWFYLFTLYTQVRLKNGWVGNDIFLKNTTLKIFPRTESRI